MKIRSFLHFSRLLMPLFCAALLSSCGGGGNSNRLLYKPYTIRGVHYTPLHPAHTQGFSEEGLASWYTEKRSLFKAGPTSLGEPYRKRAMAGAHKTLPLPCRVRVVNLRNGKSVDIRLNDRGPFVSGRILDVTPAVAKKLAFHEEGLTPVRITVLSVGD